ncbi:MAG: PP2C family serine/threonine-protein phosphatase, partial [Isosphaeraceae bacterium]
PHHATGGTTTMPPATDRTEVPTETHEYVAFTDGVANFYEAEPRCRARVQFGAKSHVGLVRSQNEDHYLVVSRRREREVIATSIAVELLPKPEQAAYVAAVADGMGGHAFGELASYLALRTGWEMGTDEVKWPVKSNSTEADELKRKALVLFRLIDRSIIAAAAEQPRHTGMGTTLTNCYSIGSDLYVFHVGDSRAYLHHEGALERLTRDHTVGQALVDAGLAAPDSPAARSRKHVLTNVLGGPAVGISVDVERRTLADGDRILLCTDGLSDFVEDAEIADALNRHADPNDVCQNLLDLALSRGGKDNVTVVVGRYEITAGPDDLFDDET